MNNYLIEGDNFIIKKLISENNITAYYKKIKTINNFNIIKLNQNIIYNIYVNGKVYINTDVIVPYDNKCTNNITQEDILIDGNIFIKIINL